MVYNPGIVKINGMELTGAFDFEGLLDFHGVLSHIRIVMDPDYQKYLYFTIVLPTFSLSKGNINFIAPNEQVELLSPEMKLVLSEAGAPKIEIQIPIETLA